MLWATWADGTVISNSSPLNWKERRFPAAQNGVLYAFDAANPNDSNMKKLYGSNDCTVGGTAVDQINPATKFSVPTVANGYVYLGTRGALSAVQMSTTVVGERARSIFLASSAVHGRAEHNQVGWCAYARSRKGGVERTITMEWTTPQIEEIALNCEINSYASATL